MWNTLALAALLTLTPGQAGDLQLSNARWTYSILGAERTSNKVLPGDILWVSFDIDNLKVDQAGKVLYAMTMELVTSKGKSEYKKDSPDLEAYNFLGGSSLPAFAHTIVGTDTPPGEYTLKVTVTDRAAKKSEILTRKFEVLPRGFGLVRVFNSYDDSGQAPAPCIGVAGQSYWINFSTVGFERTKGEKDKYPDVVVEMNVLDDKKEPTLKKPLVGQAGKDVPGDLQVVPMQFILPLNRAGKFTVQLKATDRITKKSAEVSFPITVYEAK